ncbi:MAG: DUF1957 domain-containing protein [Acidobacteriota bacterium]|nr:DUF1957 domain-containing protein [Acidobacteriota bacterium]
MTEKFNKNKKYLCFVLHSHIPYVVNHGTWPHGTDWLFEAAAETYLPLLEILLRLEREGLRAGLTISLTPVLIEQLNSQAFREGFVDYLKIKLEAAAHDYLYFQRTGEKQLMSLASYWRQWYEKIYQLFLDDFKADIISAFAHFQETGSIEIMTSAATHGYLPLLASDQSVRHQIQQGRFVYQKYFGRQPAGFWLPECAYRPGYAWQPPLGESRAYERLGVDQILAQENLDYFFVDNHLLRGGETRGVYLERFPALQDLWERYRENYQSGPIRPQNPYQPYLTHPAGVAFMARDEITGQQVWSRHSGYPGDEYYLEFHKKHFPGGLRYWRITSSSSDLADKLPYEIEVAAAKVEEHARHFVWLLPQVLKDQAQGIIASLYDTELLGHWWFEGPEWLYQVIKKLSQTETNIKLATASGCLEEIPPGILVSLPEGSWGEGGFHWIWLNDKTSWIWSKIYELEKKFWPAFEDGIKSSHLDLRLLKLLCQEKFLLESSDWPFLISTMTARDYAEARASLHFERAMKLLSLISRSTSLTAEENFWLEKIKSEDSLFREVLLPDGNII